MEWRELNVGSVRFLRIYISELRRGSTSSLDSPTFIVQFNPTFRRLATLFVGVLSLPRLSYAAAAAPNGPRVLILGGGVAGVIAARTLHDKGINNFLIVEARDELGGRMQTESFGGKIIEQGPNWIQGTQTDNGPANPIYTLAKKHNISTQFNDWFDSVSEC